MGCYLTCIDKEFPQDMYTLTIEDNPTSADVQALSQGLSDHALPYVAGPGFEPLGVFLRDEKGTILGGAWGHVNWNWLHLSFLWVSDVLRGGGYGRQLIEAIEQAAKERGCTYAHLDTFSFQARPFYERLGYEVFSTLDDYPHGHQKFLMKKELR